MVTVGNTPKYHSFCILLHAAIMCSDIADPENGQIDFSVDELAPFDFGTVATYSCDAGFGLSGGDITRTCDGDGTTPDGSFTGSAPTCESKFSLIAI